MEKITFDTWKTFIPEDMNDEVEVAIHDKRGVTHTITVRKYIPVEQRSEMIGRMSSMCCKDGSFFPMLMDFAYGFFMIMYFTGIDCTSCSIDDVNMLMCGTDIVEVIEDNIYDGGRDIYDELECDIHERMDHTDKFFNKLSGGIDDVNKMMEDSGLTMDKLLGNFMTDTEK